MAVVVTIVIWERTYVIPDVPNMSQWTPLDDIVGTVLIIPLGFFVYLFHPAGWLFWLGFGLALLMKQRSLFLFPIAASIWFGCLWPAHYHGVMGI
ncbi:MAG: hypothetical protein AAGC97_16135 [Planctomycetota bacterium]